jgi:hypothetical protein
MTSALNAPFAQNNLTVLPLPPDNNIINDFLKYKPSYTLFPCTKSKNKCYFLQTSLNFNLHPNKLEEGVRFLTNPKNSQEEREKRKVFVLLVLKDGSFLIEMKKEHIEWYDDYFHYKNSDSEIPYRFFFEHFGDFKID